MHDAAGLITPEADLELAGWSLRQARPLTAAEVATSSALLAGMGVDEPVRGLVSAALAPAEVRALQAHSCAKSWSLPLLVSQVYDKTARKARSATQLTAAHDEVGALLVGLAPADADGLIGLVVEHCPARPAAVLDAPLLANAPALLPAADALWALVAGLRGHGATPLRKPPAAPQPTPDPGAALDATWQAVVERLRASLPAADVDVWLAPTRLLALDDAGAVLGTDNIFVRDQVSQRYHEPIRRALYELTQRPLRLDVVVGGA